MLISAVKQYLFPPKCLLCGKLLGNELDLCIQCRTETEEYPFGAGNPAPREKIQLGFLDSFTAVWYYEGNVRKGIIRYKFGKRVSSAAGFGRLLGMKILKDGPQEFDILSWVPISRMRKFRRGYDQCLLLANAVGQELNMKPMKVLVKRKNTQAQSSLRDPSQRRANVQGVYKAVEHSKIAGKRILLLDDVFTTGATVNECAKVLLSAGAAEVHCAVIACAGRSKNNKLSR